MVCGVLPNIPYKGYDCSIEKKKSIHTPILSDICFGIFFFNFFFFVYFLRKILNEFLMHIKTSVDVG